MSNVFTYVSHVWRSIEHTANFDPNHTYINLRDMTLALKRHIDQKFDSKHNGKLLRKSPV